MAFANLIGLWALLSLVPLIILYLRKPKPINKVFPSLMFLLKEKGEIRKYSLFRNLLRNLLLFLQILVLICLSFAIAQPYLPTSGPLLGQHNVIVIDVSASMQTQDNGHTRFENAINTAKNYVSGRTTIVLASMMPEIVLERGSKTAALDLLSTLKPKDTTTNIESALRTAESLVKKGKIIVISDFKITEGQDPLVIKRILGSKGIQVDFIDIGKNANNIGIIDMHVNKFQTKIYVKNYKETDANVKLNLIQGKIMKTLEKTIKPMSIENLIFPTLPGKSKIELDVKDDFSIDNVVFVAAPTKLEIKVLLIENPKFESDSQEFLRHALQASPDVNLEIAEPPIVPAVSGYDVIVMGGVFSDMILPSLIKDISNAVDDGAKLIITSHTNIGNIPYGNLLPVHLTEIKEAQIRISTDTINKLTKDIGLSSVKVTKYFVGKAGNNTVVVASVDSSPILAIKDKGKGKIVFNGIMDRYSDFKLSPDYPIFWNILLNFLMGSERVEDYNLKIESTPQIAKTGYYKESSREIAVNLLNEKESDLSKTNSMTEQQDSMQFEQLKEEAKFSLETPLIILGAILILLELLYIKKRGDI